MTKKSKVIVGFLCLFLTGLQSFSQQQDAVYQSLSTNTNAYYRYLPQGYPEAGVKYSLMIFAHGVGEIGQGTPATLPLLLTIGIPKLINNGTLPTSFTVNGDTYKFIIVSPQFTDVPTPNDIQNIIDYFVNNYPVDINRIYLTGLSMGGGATWDYAGYNSSSANSLAAIVPICGRTTPTQNAADNIANANLPVWATHNDNDGVVNVSITNTLIDLINLRPSPPTPLAKKTIFNSSSHDAWTQTYDPNFKEDGKNIYEWMLQYRRNFVILAVDGLSFNTSVIDNGNKVALKWNTTAESNVQGYKILKSIDGIHFEKIGLVPTQSVNGAGAQYSFYDENVRTGKSFYKLEIMENNGASTFSDVKQITINDVATSVIYPNPAKNKLNIQTTANFNKAEVFIINTQGQNLMEATLNGKGHNSVDVSKLKPGNYIARIIIGTQIKNIKFIKQ